MKSLWLHFRQYLEHLRASRVYSSPTMMCLNKVRAALITSWLLVPLTLIVGGNFSVIAAICGAVVTLAVSGALFAHLKALGLTTKSSPIRGEAISMVVFAVALVIVAVASSGVSFAVNRTRLDIQRTDPETVTCFARFTTPANVDSPQLNEQFAAFGKDPKPWMMEHQQDTDEKTNSDSSSTTSDTEGISGKFNCRETGESNADDDKPEIPCPNSNVDDKDHEKPDMEDDKPEKPDEQSRKVPEPPQRDDSPPCGLDEEQNWLPANEIPEKENLGFSFASDQDIQLGCVLTDASLAPKNQGDNFPIKFKGKFGNLVERILSFAPVPHYPLATAAGDIQSDMVESDKIYVCTPGVYNFVTGMTSYTEAKPVPVCVDSRLHSVLTLTVTKYVMHAITMVFLFVYLGLSTSVATKAEFLAKTFSHTMDFDSEYIQPPEYTESEDQEPLLKGDVKV